MCLIAQITARPRSRLSFFRLLPKSIQLARAKHQKNVEVDGTQFWKCRNRQATTKNLQSSDYTWTTERLIASIRNG